MVLGIVYLLVLGLVSMNGLIVPMVETDETLESLAKHYVDLEAVVQRLSSQIQNITKQLALLTKHTDTGISFTAYLKSSRSCATKSTIKFDDVRNNNGGGYNLYSGVFRAPVSGTYTFSLSMSSGTDGISDYIVMKQGQRMLVVTVNGQYDTASDTSVLHLNAGDDISVECYESSGSLTLRGGGFSYFTGYLLHAD